MANSNVALVHGSLSRQYITVLHLIWKRWTYDANKRDSSGDQDLITAHDEERNQRRRNLILGRIGTVGLAVSFLSMFRYRDALRAWLRRYYAQAVYATLRRPSQGDTLSVEKTRFNTKGALETPLSVLFKALTSDVAFRVIQRAVLVHLGGDCLVYYQLEPQQEGTESPIDVHNPSSNCTWRKSTLPPGTSTTELVERLARSGTEVVVRSGESLLSQATTVVLTLVPFLYLAFVWRMMRRHFNSIEGNDSSFNYPTASSCSPSSGPTLDDVAGIDAAKAAVVEVVQFIHDPARYSRLGARPPRSVLLYGAPGTGKTYLARAVATTARVPFLHCTASEFCEVYVGRGAARVRRLFQSARLAAQKNQNVPGASCLNLPLGLFSRSAVSSNSAPAAAIVFIDELDAIAQSRSGAISGGRGHSNEEREQTLNQLLTELDGFCQYPEVNLVVICATNRADVLDPAVLRRMDRRINVPLPNHEGRIAILRRHASRLRLAGGEHMDWSVLAADSCGFSGSDLEVVVNEAALAAVRDGDSMVGMRHFEQSLRYVKEMKRQVSSGEGLKFNLGTL
jgi:ATP-dependent 26S proteasome regulatory subunit